MSGGIFNNRFTAHLLGNQPVKEVWKSLKIWQRYHHEYRVSLFMEHGVVQLQLHTSRQKETTHHQSCMQHLVRTTKQAGGCAVHWLTPADHCQRCPSAARSASVTQAPTHWHPCRHCSPTTSTPCIDKPTISQSVYQNVDSTILTAFFRFNWVLSGFPWCPSKHMKSLVQHLYCLNVFLANNHV